MGNSVYNTAVLNTVVVMPGITGDTSVFSPVGTQPINKRVDDTQPVEVTLKSGRKVLIKKRQLETEGFETPAGNVEVPSENVAYNPSQAKPTQLFYNREKQRYDAFNNALGTSQARMMVVMPIQSMDGDTVKWTTLFVNKDKKLPEPVLWVHDSIISTPGSSLLYRNAYNNVAIPNAIPQIAKMGKKFEGIVREARRREVERLKAAGRAVGIGTDGQYPALGAYFDELLDKATSESYKKIYLERKHNSPEKYDAMVKHTEKLLKEAEDNGWVRPGQMPADQQRSLAVTPKQFENLVDIVGDHLEISGPEDKLSSWANDFAGRVNRTAQILLSASRRGGINQMSYGSSGERAKK